MFISSFIIIMGYMTLGPGPSAHAAGFGAQSGLFLNEPSSVRAAALGQAYTALADDEGALSSNPAGLAKVQSLALSGTHAFNAFDTREEYLSLCSPAANFGELGFQAGYLYN